MRCPTNGAGLGLLEIARISDIGLQWTWIENREELDLSARIDTGVVVTNISVSRGPVTLGIEGDAETGTVSLSGSSYPEDAFAFFESITNWIESYFDTDPKTFTLVCEIDHLNSSSSKSLFDLLDMGEHHAPVGCKSSVIWRHPAIDPDMRIVGEEFAEDVTIPFTFEETE